MFLHESLRDSHRIITDMMLTAYARIFYEDAFFGKRRVRRVSC